MQEYPHHYRVSADAGAVGEIMVRSPGLEDLPSMPPAEFGGPGDKWSPETFLVAAVADCYILTFRAISRASRYEWIDIRCSVNGILDRVDNVTQFTRYEIDVDLTVPTGSVLKKAERLLEKSEAVCLVTNSLTGEKVLNINIREA